MGINSNQHVINLIDDAIDRALKKCLLEEKYQDNLDKSANALKKLKDLGPKPKELFLEHENYKNLTDYSLIFSACVECVVLGMDLQRIINR